MIRILAIASLLMLFLTLVHAQNGTIVWEPERRLSFDTSNVTGQRIFAIGDTLHLFWQPYLTDGDYMTYVRSLDGGTTWSQPRNVRADTLHNSGWTDMIAVSDSHIYLYWITCDTCDGLANHYFLTFRRSTDAGATFEPYVQFLSGSIAIDAGSITATDSFVVRLYSSQGGFLQVSSDHGVTWQTRPLPFRNFQKVHLDRSHILHMIQPAVGTLRPEVSHSYSTDFGTGWTSETVLSTVDAFPSDQAQIVGNTQEALFVVWNDGKYGTTNGFAGSILLRRSTNGGQSWEPEVRLTNLSSAGPPGAAVASHLTSVVWHNEAQPFQGISLRLSTDSGVTWLAEAAVSDSSRPAGDPDVVLNDSHIHVVWSDGRTGRSQVYYRRGRITTTGVKAESHPRQFFTLWPNYPNPFNSTTKIRFAIATSGFVSLRVYDMLGREVATLTERDMPAGRFEASLDAARLASGIYYYRLLVGGDGIVTKKMILIR